MGIHLQDKTRVNNILSYNHCSNSPRFDKIELNKTSILFFSIDNENRNFGFDNHFSLNFLENDSEQYNDPKNIVSFLCDNSRNYRAKEKRGILVKSQNTISSYTEPILKFLDITPIPSICIVKGSTDIIKIKCDLINYFGFIKQPTKICISNNISGLVCQWNKLDEGDTTAQIELEIVGKDSFYLYMKWDNNLINLTLENETRGFVDFYDEENLILGSLEINILPELPQKFILFEIIDNNNLAPDLKCLNTIPNYIDWSEVQNSFKQCGIDLVQVKPKPNPVSGKDELDLYKIEEYDFLPNRKFVKDQKELLGLLSDSLKNSFNTNSQNFFDTNNILNTIGDVLSFKSDYAFKVNEEYIWFESIIFIFVTPGKGGDPGISAITNTGYMQKSYCVVQKNPKFPYKIEGILSHEMAHSLGIQHTFLKDAKSIYEEKKKIVGNVITSKNYINLSKKRNELLASLEIQDGNCFWKEVRNIGFLESMKSVLFPDGFFVEDDYGVQAPGIGEVRQYLFPLMDYKYKYNETNNFMDYMHSEIDQVGVVKAYYSKDSFYKFQWEYLRTVVFFKGKINQYLNM